MKSIILSLSIIGAIFMACTPEASHPTYTGETDPSVKKEFNQTVARSEVGFSQSYRATYTNFSDPDPLFRQAQSLMGSSSSKQWLKLSTDLKPLIEELDSKGKSMEVQLLCLMMIDRYFLPVVGDVPRSGSDEFYSRFAWFFEKLIEHKGIDLDIMTDAFLALKEYLVPSKANQYSKYLIETAKRDIESSDKRLNNVQDDEQAFGEVSKRMAETIKKEAEYTLAKLDQRQ
jgi:hypothetical protein